MHPMTRIGVSRNLDYHQALHDHYKQLVEAEEEAAGEQQAVQEDRRITRRRGSADESEQATEHEQEQAPAKEEPKKSHNRQAMELHAEVVRQLFEVLNAEPVQAAIHQARADRPVTRDTRPRTRPVSRRLQ